MSLLPVGLGSGAGYEIPKSLRFRASASAYLSRTPGSAGNRRTWTWSGWVKRGALGTNQTIFGANDAGNQAYTLINFNTSDRIYILTGTTIPSNPHLATSSAVFRDPSAHYHIVSALDTTQADANLRWRVWVNGVEITMNRTATVPQNTELNVNTTQPHFLGRQNPSIAHFDGYLSEINFIDGQALTPTSFGQFDANGVWQPRKYTGTYGTNGFYLPFNDGTNLTNLCLDRSSNGNNWTATNVSLTAGATYDWMDDTPTNNFAVLNPLYVRSGSPGLTSGNLNFSTPGTGAGEAAGTVSLPNSGKFYWEVAITTMATSRALIGLGQPYVGTTVFTNSTSGCGYYSLDGTVIIGNVTQFTGATYTVGDVIGVAVDRDAGQVSFYKNNVLQGTATFNVPDCVPLFCSASTSVVIAGNINFGQRPFAYTPPTGFKALCTKNLTSTTVTASGSFTGNANADGPFVWLNGVPTAMTINGNAVTFATHADRTAGGFKVRSSAVGYNAAGTNSYTITTTGAAFKNARAQVNP